VNKAAIHVVALDDALAQFPFPILGIDSDNGSEFINTHLYEYCLARKITFTRSRPGNKNDGAHVEQKNGTHVRSLVGYLRYDTPTELKILNEIWALDQRFTNLLCAQQKLISRERVGAKVIKRHDTAQTPHQRAVASSAVGPGKKPLSPAPSTGSAPVTGNLAPFRGSARRPRGPVTREEAPTFSSVAVRQFFR
jgi:hypothetical protein